MFWRLPVGYTTRDVLYRWNPSRQVAIADDMKLSQFDLIANPAANHTDILKTGELQGVRGLGLPPRRAGTRDNILQLEVRFLDHSMSWTCLQT